MDTSYIPNRNGFLFMNDENNINVTLDLIQCYNGPTYVFMDMNKPFHCRIVRSKNMEKSTNKQIKIFVIESLLKQYEQIFISNPDILNQIKMYQKRLLYNICVNN